MITIPYARSVRSMNPLQHLSDALSDDMEAVNAAILEHMESPVALIPQLAAHLIEAGGKRLRPLLTLAATQIYGGDMKRAHVLAAAVEFIHSATLLHDDVVDESLQRRGNETANAVFGNQASVLVGDFLFSRAFQLMVKDGNLEILRILSDASAIIAQGEVMQLATTNNLETTLDDYIEVVKAKTAALFAAGCEVGPMIASQGHEQAEAFAAYGMHLGIAFQIADDALDYISESKTIGKTRGDDFREGKMTAPVIFALGHADTEERDFWQRTIADKEQKDGDFEKALALLEKYKSIEHSYTLAMEYAQMAKESLKAIPDHDLKSILMDIADFAAMRKS